MSPMISRCCMTLNYTELILPLSLIRVTISPMLTLSDIQLAQKRIQGATVRTPLIPYPRQTAGRNLFFKAENLQPMGAFKLRGAYNAIASLTAEERARGVVAHSSGN